MGERAWMRKGDHGMSRQDPWSEFLDRLLVTASLTDTASAPVDAGRLPADDDFAGVVASTARFGRAAPREVASQRAIPENRPQRD